MVSVAVIGALIVVAAVGGVGSWNRRRRTARVPVPVPVSTRPTVRILRDPDQVVMACRQAAEADLRMAFYFQSRAAAYFSAGMGNGSAVDGRVPTVALPAGPAGAEGV